MPARIPLIHGGQVPLRQTGDYTAKTPRLVAGDTGLGDAIGAVGNLAEKAFSQSVKVNDERQMLEAEGAMRGLLEQQMKFQQENDDEQTWLPNLDRLGTELQQRFDGMKISPSMRSTLNGALGRVTGQQRLGVLQQGQQHSVIRLEQSYQKRYDQAVAAGNVSEVEQIGHLMTKNGNVPAEKAQVMKFQAMKDAGARAYELNWTQANNLVKEGRLEDAKTLLKSLNLPEQLESIEFEKLDVLNQSFTERRTQEKKGGFYGSILGRIAQREVLLPQQVQILAQEQQMDVQSTSRLTQGVQRGGVPAPQLESFINRHILTYNPHEDESRQEWASIQQSAVEMGVNAAQASRLQTLIQTVVKNHETPAGRKESRAWMQGREQILKVISMGQPGSLRARQSTAIVQQPHAAANQTQTAPLRSPGHDMGVLEAYDLWFDEARSKNGSVPSQEESKAKVQELTRDILARNGWAMMRGDIPNPIPGVPNKKRGKSLGDR